MSVLSSFRSGDRQTGFTLLEVLVAVAVFGFLVMALTQGVRTGVTLHQAQSRRVDQTEDLDAAMRALRGMLSRLPVVPEGVGLVASTAGAAFKGEPDRVSFVGRMPTDLGSNRLAEMTLAVRDHRLMLSWLPHRHEVSAVTRMPNETELLGDIDRIELAYWGSPAAGQPGAWQARWESPQAPELLRMRLVFAKGDKRHWPDLLVASRLR